MFAPTHEDLKTLRTMQAQNTSNTRVRTDALKSKLASLRPDLATLNTTYTLFQTEPCLQSQIRNHPSWPAYQSRVETIRRKISHVETGLGYTDAANTLPSNGQLAAWEEALEDVRISLMSAAERDMDNGWENSVRSKKVVDKAGLFGGWNWEEADSKAGVDGGDEESKEGAGLDPLVDPLDASKPNPDVPQDMKVEGVVPTDGGRPKPQVGAFRRILSRICFRGGN